MRLPPSARVGKQGDRKGPCGGGGGFTPLITVLIRAWVKLEGGRKAYRCLFEAMKDTLTLHLVAELIICQQGVEHIPLNQLRGRERKCKTGCEYPSPQPHKRVSSSQTYLNGHNTGRIDSVIQVSAPEHVIKQLCGIQSTRLPQRCSPRATATARRSQTAPRLERTHRGGPQT